MMKGLAALLTIRENEQRSALHFCLIFFLIGTGLAIGRSSADALFFKRYGIQYLPVMYGVLSVIFAVTSIAYASFADRISSERAFNRIFAAFMLSVGASWLLIVTTGWEVSYPIYFVVYEIASELLLLHGALYIAQNFETIQTKRLSPIFFGSAQLGTIVGGLFVAVALAVVNIQIIMPVWCIILFTSWYLVRRYHAQHGTSPFYRHRRTAIPGLKAGIEEVRQGLHFTRRSSLLRAASFSLFFMVIAFYVMCYSLNKIYTNTFPSAEALGQFFGILTAVTSAIALFVQFVLTSRLLHHFGVKKLNLVFPFGGLAAYISLLMSFSFLSALVGSFTRDVLMPAIRRPTRNLFFNALPDYIQGRARAVAVSLVLPAALAVASVILVLFSKQTFTFLVIGLIANIVYFYFALRMNKAYVSVIAGKLRERLFVPDGGLEVMLHKGAGEVLAELRKGVQHPDESVAQAYADLLVRSDVCKAESVVIDRLASAGVACQDRLLNLLSDHGSTAVITYCRNSIQHAADPHIRATMLRILIRSNERDVEPLLKDLLEDGNPRIAALGILGVKKFNTSHLMEAAQKRWFDLLHDDREEHSIPALELLVEFPEQTLYPLLLEKLASPGSRAIPLLLAILEKWPHPELPERLEDVLSLTFKNPDPKVRVACVKCFRLLPEDRRDQLYIDALDDRHEDVQETALTAMDDGTAGFTNLLAGLLIGNAGSPRAQRAILNYMKDRPLTKTLLWEIAEAKASDAGAIAEAIQTLEATNPSGTSDNPWFLLTETLTERKREVLNLALLALERADPGEDIQSMRAALNTRDPRHIANAIEALSHLPNKAVARTLVRVLEDGMNPDERGRNGTHSKNAKQVLDWCNSRPDPWLRETVAYTRTILQGTG